MAGAELSKTYDPKLVEETLYQRWSESGFFNPDKLLGRPKKNFVIMMALPNITGSLHIGHALEASLIDCIVRWKRMQGYRTLYLPGTDHAGIATQNAVEKELKKEGRTRFDIGREKFLERVWTWKEKYGGIILQQLRSIGVSCDWSRERFTMDPKYADAVVAAFTHYHEKGWIYRGERVVNWCTRCGTSLSDLELEYREEQGKLWYIRYPLSAPSHKPYAVGHKQNKNGLQPTSYGLRQAYITVATTRPETMLGDTAVAVHPDDERYKNLVGKSVRLPLANREIPIVADPIVDQVFGTGALKLTPGHDLADAEIGERHSLATLKIIDELGKITDAAPESYRGMRVEEARTAVIRDLEAQNLIEKVEDYTHNVAICYRCGTTVEPLPSLQWFLKMSELAAMSKEAYSGGRVSVVPERFHRIALERLEHERDWCLSRQLWWGHRLPVWFCKTTSDANLQIPHANDTNGIRSIRMQDSRHSHRPREEFIVSLEKPEKCPVCGECEMQQSEDVLDTWFSSALWPFATLGWLGACEAPRGTTQNSGGAEQRRTCVPKKGSDLEKYYPNQWMTSAREILFLWINRMVFSGMEFMGQPPFQDVYIHPTVLTKTGKRMSKSLGTGIDPLVLIDKYGADAVRFGLLWQLSGTQDIRFDEGTLVAGKKFLNKLWNAARYTLSQTKGVAVPQKEPSSPEREDQELIEQLRAIIKETDQDLQALRFAQGLERVYAFFWHTFCDKYLEATKRRDDDDAKKVLLYTLATTLKLLHPFIPFITEELWSQLPKSSETLLMVEQWPNA